MFGTGIGNLGFGAEFTPTPDIGTTHAPIDARGWSVEHRAGILPNMPWYMAVHPGSFVCAHGIASLKESFFVGKWVRRSLDSVRDDPRLKHTAHITGTTNRSNYRKTDYGMIYDPREHVDLLEIRDQRTKKVIILAPSFTDKVLLYEDDEMQSEGGPPYYDIVFNPDDEVFWGVPDSQILEPYQLEINEIKTQMMKHRRLALVKWLTRKGVISPGDIDRLHDENVASIVQLEITGDIRGALQAVTTADIPTSLIQAANEIMQDVRETMGFSRNAFGDVSPPQARTSKFEAQTAAQAGEIRIDERRDATADVLVRLVKDMHRVIFKHWQSEQVIDVVGPAGLPIWVRFSGDMLKMGSYDVKVDPDSSVPETREAREAKSERIYALFSRNPMIDPLELTKYLLHEHHGVAFDSMLKQQGGTQENPMSVPQLAQSMQNQQQLQSGPG